MTTDQVQTRNWRFAEEIRLRVSATAGLDASVIIGGSTVCSAVDCDLVDIDAVCLSHSVMVPFALTWSDGAHLFSVKGYDLESFRAAVRAEARRGVACLLNLVIGETYIFPANCQLCSFVVEESKRVFSVGPPKIDWKWIVPLLNEAVLSIKGSSTHSDKIAKSLDAASLFREYYLWSMGAWGDQTFKHLRRTGVNAPEPQVVRMLESLEQVVVKDDSSALEEVLCDWRDRIKPGDSDEIFVSFPNHPRISFSDK